MSYHAHYHRVIEDNQEAYRCRLDSGGATAAIITVQHRGRGQKGVLCYF